jgi:hypothetical protein
MASNPNPQANLYPQLSRGEAPHLRHAFEGEFLDKLLARAELLFTMPGALTTGVKKPSYRPSFRAMIEDVRVNVDTAPSGGSCVVDIQKNGTSIYVVSAKPTIAAGAFFSPVAKLTIADTTFWTPDDKLEVEVETANAAADAVVAIGLRRVYRLGAA